MIEMVRFLCFLVLATLVGCSNPTLTEDGQIQEDGLWGDFASCSEAGVFNCDEIPEAVEGFEGQLEELMTRNLDCYIYEFEAVMVYPTPQDLWEETKGISFSGVLCLGSQIRSTEGMIAVYDVETQLVGVIINTKIDLDILNNEIPEVGSEEEMLQHLDEIRERIVP